MAHALGARLRRVVAEAVHGARLNYVLKEDLQ